jgi:hypothetical protein
VAGGVRFIIIIYIPQGIVHIYVPSRTVTEQYALQLNPQTPFRNVMRGLVCAIGHGGGTIMATPWADPLRVLGPLTRNPSSITDDVSSILSDPKGLDNAFEQVDKLLDLYRPVADDDKTVDFLRVFLNRLPKEGQAALLSDILDIGRDDEKLRTLRDHLVDVILKPSRLSILHSYLAMLNYILPPLVVVAGGKMPMTPLTAPVYPQAAAQVDVAMAEIESSSRADQKKLKGECLRRDGFRCVFSGFYDLNSAEKKRVDAPPGSIAVKTECAHILPFALRKFDENNALETRNKAIIWLSLHRYFPALKGKIDASTINQPQNAITFIDMVHSRFGSYRLAFWPTDKVCFRLNRDFLERI